MKLFILEGSDWDHVITTFFIATSMGEATKLMSELYEKWKPISTKRNALIDAFSKEKKAFNKERDAQLAWGKEMYHELWADHDAGKKGTELKTLKSGFAMAVNSLRQYNYELSQLALEDTLENQRYKHATYHVEVVEQSLCLDGNKATCIQRWQQNLRVVESNTFIDRLSTDLTVVL